VAVMDADRLRAIENFTRNPGLAFLAVMIQDGTGAEVILLGVQPKATKFAAELTKSVKHTLHALEDLLVNVY
jgi:hypothetical protein